MKLNEQHTEKFGKVIPFSQTSDALYNRGMQAYRKKDFNKAIYFIEKAIHLDSEDPVLYCQLAAIHSELGDYEKSNELLKTVLGTYDKTMYECYFFLANNYAHMGLFDQAEEMANQYIQLEKDGEFYQDCKDLLDLIQFDKDELEEWTDELSEEDILITIHDQAYIYLHQGNYDLAIEQFDKIIEENPTFWSAYNHKAEALFSQGKKEEAIQVTMDLLMQDAGNLTALGHLALFFNRLGRSEESLVMVEQLKRVQPLDIDQRFKLAETFIRIRNYDLAYPHLVALKKARYDGEGKLLHCYAVAAFHCGYVEKAIAVWKKLQKAGDPIARKLLTIHDKQGLTKEIVQYE
jgi:tetratricopeptide (TPR) repeat protein